MSVETIHELTEMPIRIDIERGVRIDRETHELSMTSIATIREYPNSPRKVGKVLWGPISVPGNPDASWAELLRGIADAFDTETSPGAQ